MADRVALVACFLIGVLSLAIWIPAGDAVFQGDAPSLMPAFLLMAGVLAAGVVVVLRLRKWMTWPALAIGMVLAVSGLAVGHVGFVFVNESSGHCNERYHAIEWIEPGLYASLAENGSIDGSRYYQSVDVGAWDLDISAADQVRVALQHPSDQTAALAAINQTIDFPFAFANVEPSTAVC